MVRINIKGSRDNSINISGAINRKVNAGPTRNWTGILRSPGGDVVKLKATFGVDNPNGWQVDIVEATHKGVPWPFQITENQLSRGSSEVDYGIDIQVPDGTVLQ